jgi:hypothetical protein
MPQLDKFTTDWLDTLSTNTRLFVVVLFLLFLQALFLFYLFLALMVHRKDRKELSDVAVAMGMNLKFNYSWRGVFLEISHPRITPTKEKEPPSPPLGD